MARLALAALIFAGAVCLAPARSTVLVWGLGLGPNGQGLEAGIREFERLHPEYDIRAVNVGAGRMNPQKLMTGIVGGVPPDVVYQDRFTVIDWASRGAFLPLDAWLSKDPNSPKREQFYPAAWDESVYQGHQYALPATIDTRVLYWNAEIFRENAPALSAAGLDPTRAPKTWKELLAYNKILTKKDAQGRIVQAGFIPNYGNAWLYLYGRQNGRDFISADGQRATLDPASLSDTLSWMKLGYATLGGYESASAFASSFTGGPDEAFLKGKLAMKIDGSWILASLARYAPNLDFQVAPPPTPSGKTSERFLSWSGGFSYSIPKNARNPDGAWLFLRYMTSLQGMRVQEQAEAQADQKRNRLHIPTWRARRNFENVSALPAGFQKALDVQRSVLASSAPRTPSPISQLFWNEQAHLIEAVCAGYEEPKAAVMAAQKRLQAGLDRFYAPQIQSLAPIWPLALLFGAALLLFLSPWLRLKRSQETKWALLFLAPWLIGFTLFVLWPVLASFYYSFTTYEVLSPARWAGLQNYHDLFVTDRAINAKSLTNALILAAIGVPLQLATGLSIALLLQGRGKGVSLSRAAFYLPSILPTVAAGVLWIWLLAPQGGLVNQIWSTLLTSWSGWQPPLWLQSESWAKPALILMGLWGAGGGLLLWLAGLHGIRAELYEAATLDGAKPRQLFSRITLPLLTPLIFFNLVMGLVIALQEFDRIYVMRPDENAAGPNDSLLVPMFRLYQEGYGAFHMGYASALAWVLLLLLLLLTSLQFKFAPRWVFYEGEPK